MIDWTNVKDAMPEPLENFASYSFLTDRFRFRPCFFIGMVQDANSMDKYRSYFGRFDHVTNMWLTMQNEQVFGVAFWTEYNEPSEL